MEIGCSNSVCKGGGEIDTSFPEVGLGSWICISLRTATFFLEYTFAGHSILSKLSGRRLKFRDKINGWRLRFRGKGYKYWTSDFRRVNGKGINEVGISILVFLEGIFPLKIRSGKMWWVPGFGPLSLDGSLYILFFPTKKKGGKKEIREEQKKEKNMSMWGQE